MKKGNISIIVTLLSCISLICINSCKKDAKTSAGSGSVIVVNEGNFQHGNASVSLYDPATKGVSNDVFHTTNGFAMGDVAQELVLVGDTAFIVMNNSQNIVVADAARSFTYLYSIPIPNSSPRFFLPLNATKAYVSDLYSGKIWIINYRTGSLTGHINVSGWTEQMIAANDKIYVVEKTAPGSGAIHKILQIDPAIDAVVASIDLNTDPNSIALADHDKLYAIGAAQDNPSHIAQLYIIDLSSFSIEHTLDFAAAHTPAYLRFDAFSHRILYADNGIYTLSQTDTVLPVQPLIAANSWNIYGLNTDPATGDIYISDAIDYQQASRVMRYSSSAASIDAFSAGIITNSFVFR